MNQVFTGTVIRLKNPKTATVELVSIKIHPKYLKPQRTIKPKKVHYEVTETQIINWLTQYFQENQVKEISLKDRELVVNYDDGETSLLGKVIKKHELWNVKDYLTKTKQNSLTAEKLKELSNSNSSQTEFPLCLGDKVRIKSDRPRSKTKRFVVIEKEKL